MSYEYKVVPAPSKGRKLRGLRRQEDRFAFAIQELMNEMAQLGWEFLRKETLPQTDVRGWFSRGTQERNLLVFRRVAQTRSATSSLEATLREVATPMAAAAPVVESEPSTVAVDTAEDAYGAEALEAPEVAGVPEVAPPAQEPQEYRPEIAHPVEPAAPRRVAPNTADEPRTRFATRRAQHRAAVDTPPLYEKHATTEHHAPKASVLPAALRSRASQTLDPNKS